MGKYHLYPKTTSTTWLGPISNFAIDFDRDHAYVPVLRGHYFRPHTRSLNASFTVLASRGGWGP